MTIRQLIAIFVCISLSISALEAQMARKIPMFEHFTQSSCGPCATFNPVFQAVRVENIGSLNHVAYHTSWPGFDPMYNANPSEADAMVGNYGVTGVPTMILDGTDIGSPAAATQGSIDAAASPGSPIRILVSEETVGTTRNATIVVQSAVAPPSGTFRMRVMVVEDNKTYLSPPGSNGETYFPNVFRDMLTTTAGDAITLPAEGMSVSSAFSYTLDPTWIAEEVYVLAYVYNVITREVLNSGSSLLSPVEVSNPGGSFVEGIGTNNFSAAINNLGTGAESVTIEVTADHPSDWAVEYEILGTTYSGTTTVTVPASSVEDLDLRVTNGSTPGLGEYVVSVSWDGNPDLAPQNIKYYVIHDVTDLVVTNAEGWGAGTVTVPIDEWAAIFDGALNNAGRMTRASTDHFAFLKGMDEGALGGVYNLYYNVGWSFPSFTDAKVEAFEAFLDNGGNMLISGQDIGWDTFEPGGSGTVNTRNFFNNYIQGTYISDGSPSSSTVNFVSSDAWFGSAGSSGISAPYGSAYVYPDEVNPGGPDASPVFYYNGIESKTGALRTETNDYKVVFFGIGVEMFADAAVQLAAVELSHDYFWDGVSGIEFDEAFAAALGQNQPNPANNFTQIPLNNLENQAILRILDLNGRIVSEQLVSSVDKSVNINLEEFSTGIYTYYLQSGNSVSAARKLSVVK